MLNTHCYGHSLQAALEEVPHLSLDFYSYGVMLRKRDGEQLAEYPVDPAQVAVALAAEITLDTGLLTDETLLVRQTGVHKTVVAYRKAQQTGIYLEGTDTALRVPLPPLLLIRTTREERTPTYALYAVKSRPKSLEVPLFHAPLPNVFHSGSICWGTVAQVEVLAGASLAADWARLLGSPFGTHACHGKSQAFPQDIRQQLIALEARHAKRYPLKDLVPAKKTLAALLDGGR